MIVCQISMLLKIIKSLVHWPQHIEILAGYQNVAFNLLYMRNVGNKMASFEE